MEEIFMKVSVNSIRPIASVALVAGETFTLIYFYPRRDFNERAFFSLLIFFSAFNLLFENWKPIRRTRGLRRIRGLGFVILALLCLIALRYWIAGDHISAMALAAIPGLAASSPLVRLSWRPAIRDWHQIMQDKKIATKLIALVIGTLSFITLDIMMIAARSWILALSTFWSILSSILALFSLCLSVLIVLTIWKVTKKLGVEPFPTQNCIAQEDRP
jgi:hypothetical protein